MLSRALVVPFLLTLGCAVTTGGAADRGDGSVPPDHAIGVMVDGAPGTPAGPLPPRPPSPPGLGMRGDPCVDAVDLESVATSAGEALVYEGSNADAPEQVTWDLSACASDGVGAGFARVFRVSVPAGTYAQITLESLPSPGLAPLALRVMDTCGQPVPNAFCLNALTSDYPEGEAIKPAVTRALPTADGRVTFAVMSTFPTPSTAVPAGRFRLAVRLAPAAERGAPCGILAGPSDILTGPLCARGLSCDLMPYGEGRCVSPTRRVRGPCVDDRGCADEFACAGRVCSPRVPVVPLGEPCNDANPAVYCDDSGVCASDASGRRCVPRGAIDLACRTTAPQCDAGLGCGVDGRCHPVTTDLAVCDYRRGCPTGTTCIAPPRDSFRPDPMLPGRCVADGALAGACRAREPRCDLGLRCTPWGCAAPAMVGGTCVPGDLTNPCPTGSACRRGVCLAEGIDGGACRLSANPCDAGLGCARGICRPLGTSGATCGGAGYACPFGTRCTTARFTDANGVCTADGRERGRCRASVPPCDPGLTCLRTDPANDVCARPAGPGGACDPELPNGCVLGALCDGDRTCHGAGTLRGPCRATEPRCDGDLGCVNGARCERVAQLGAACDRAPACAEGLICAGPPTGGTGAPTCRGAGVEFARCRAATPRCDDGLTCDRDFDTCLRVRAIGAGCTLDDPFRAQCADGASCRRTASGVVCVAYGAPGGRCRVTGAPCDAGLRCFGTPGAADSICR